MSHKYFSLASEFSIKINIKNRENREKMGKSLSLSLFSPINIASAMAQTWSPQSMLDRTFGIMAVPRPPVYMTEL